MSIFNFVANTVEGVAGTVVNTAKLPIVVTTDTVGITEDEFSEALDNISKSINKVGDLGD